MLGFLDFVENIKDIWESWGVKIKVKPINHGVQLGVGYKGGEFNARVYDSKKKGVTIDWSQVKDADAVNDLKNMLDNTYDPENASYVKTNDESRLDIVGSDEAGKGDTFGGIAVAAAYVPYQIIPELKKLGVTDSKKLTDDKMFDIVREIFFPEATSINILDQLNFSETVSRVTEPFQLCGRSKYPITAAVMLSDPNPELTDSELLNTMHSTVLASAIHMAYDQLILADPFAVVVDQYCHTLDETSQLHHQISCKFDDVLSNSIGYDVDIHTKAESDTTAVALASILARVLYLCQLNHFTEKCGIYIPTGSSDKANRVLRALKNGGFKLPEFAKTNFANVQKYMSEDMDRE